jgi:phage tail-like protein
MFLEKELSSCRDVVIKLLDDEHKPIIVWIACQAWPCKLTYAPLRADANEVLIETLELVHEGLSIEEANN